VYRDGFSRDIEPEALARLVGWHATLKQLVVTDALLAMRAEGSRRDGGCRGKTSGDTE